MLEKIRLENKQILISESETNPDSLIGKFIICDFSTNKNGVRLNRDTIDTWLKTLINKPLVGRLQTTNGVDDFTSHNVKYIKTVDENGNETEELVFDTDAVGTFYSAEIETIDGVEYIVATCEIWKRFPRACKVIERRVKEGTIATSWEIAVEDSKKVIESGRLVKVVNAGRFLSHCLLGSTVEPAYDSSKLLECASENEDGELFSAILQDVASQNNNPQGNEVQTMPNENEPVIENGEQIPATPPTEQAEVTHPVEVQPVVEPVVEEKPAIAELTMRDLRRKIEEALYNFADRYLDVVFIFTESHTGWAHAWDENETDMYEFAYAVENDEVTVTSNNAVKLLVTPREINSAISARDDTILSLNTKIQTLESEVSTLSPYKEAHEQAERERQEEEKKVKVAELRKYVEDANMFTKEELEGDELSSLISELKTVEVKAKIADRIVEKQIKTRKPETASVQKPQPKPKADINTETTQRPGEVLKDWLYK